MLYLITGIFTLLWIRDISVNSAMAFLVVPGVIGIYLTAREFKSLNLQYSMLTLSVIGYFLVLLLSHFFNQLSLTPRLAHWFLVTSASVFALCYQPRPIRISQLLVIFGLILAVTNNSNVRMMALVSLAVLCCKTSKSLGVICLLLSLFYGHLFLDSDSLLLAIPIGLAVGLTGRERVLALALLIVCLFELVLTRSEQYSPMGSRDTFFRQAKIAFLESPLLGKGDCGGYFESCDEYGMLAKHAHGHNIFVTNLCETGALGLLPLIPFLMFMILRAPNFDLAQKLFWGIFATWSMTDDPFNFVPFVPLVGLLLIHR